MGLVGFHLICEESSGTRLQARVTAASLKNKGTEQITLLSNKRSFPVDFPPIFT